MSLAQRLLEAVAGGRAAAGRDAFGVAAEVQSFEAGARQPDPESRLFLNKDIAQ